MSVLMVVVSTRSTQLFPPPQEGDMRIAESSYVVYGNNVMSALLLEVSLSGVGMVLRLERDPWSMVK